MVPRNLADWGSRLFSRSGTEEEGLLVERRYRIVRRLGVGGMGEVFLADDLKVGRPVALKLLASKSVGSRWRERFEAEARVTARLEHPGVVPVYDVGTFPDGRHFFAMRYVDGSTFAVHITQGIKTDSFIRWMTEVCRIVAHAHARGIVHRDLKPTNLMIDATGRAFVLDWGLASILDPEPVPDSKVAGATRAGTTLGTPGYMAPEQERGETDRISVRSDVYALGAILREGLHGRMSHAMAAVVRRAMSQEPGDRYADAGALAEELQRLQSDHAVEALRSDGAYRFQMFLRRHRWFATTGAAAALVCALIFWPVLRRAEDRTDEVRRQALAQLEKRTGTALAAALELRRSGNLKGMEQFGRDTEEACREAMSVLPESAEPHYALGRMYRALLREEEALREQNEALRMDPEHVRARYERVVLQARNHHRFRREKIFAALRAGVAADLTEDSELREFQIRISEDLSTLQRALHIEEGALACAQGYRAWVEGKIDDARESFQQAIRCTPRLEESYEVMAMLEHEAGRYEEAVRWWSAGIDADAGYRAHREGRLITRMAWGLVEDERGGPAAARYCEVIDESDVLLKTRPGDPELSILQVRARVSLAEADRTQTEQQLRDAERTLDQLNETSPTAEVFLWKGAVALNRGRFLRERGGDPGEALESAAGWFSRALEADASLARSWEGRGSVRINQGLCLESVGSSPVRKYEEAIADFDEAIERNRSLASAWMGRGDARKNLAACLQEQGVDPSEGYALAIGDYDEVIRLRPESGDGFRARGGVHLNLGQDLQARGLDPEESYEAAERDLQEALGRNPSDREALYWRAGLWMNRGTVEMAKDQDPTELFERAIEDLSTLISLDPDRAEPWRLRGDVRLNLLSWMQSHGGDVQVMEQEALSDYERGLQIDRQDALAWWHHGMVLEGRAYRLARTQDDAASGYLAALKSYETCVRINPSLAPSVHEALQRCRMMLQKR